MVAVGSSGPLLPPGAAVAAGASASAATQLTASAAMARRCPLMKLSDTWNQLLLWCGGASLSVTGDTLGTVGLLPDERGGPPFGTRTSGHSVRIEVREDHHDNGVGAPGRVSRGLPRSRLRRAHAAAAARRRGPGRRDARPLCRPGRLT